MTDDNGIPESLDVTVDGVDFELRLFEGPSGLRGQVFRGEEKIAGVQIYHDRDPQKLVRMVERDAAVRRAVERINKE